MTAGWLVLSSCSLVLDADKYRGDEDTGSKSVCTTGEGLSHPAGITVTAPAIALELATPLYPYMLSTDAPVLAADVAMLPSFEKITQSDGVTMATVLVVESLHIAPDVTLTVFGENPLIIVSASDIIIEGTIDASSRLGAFVGAGADPSVCSTGGAGHDAPDIDSGGGGGGGFAFPGGEGGAGATFTGGGRGEPQGRPTIVRGGCRGGIGGGPRTEVPIASGGGAFQLLACRDIKIAADALLAAGGAGGNAGQMMAGSLTGGDGGGSGGFIGLDAASITFGNVPGQRIGGIVANGGGGGGGSDGMEAGKNGNDGSPIPTLSTLGGAGGGEGGKGGNGSSPGNEAGQAGDGSGDGALGSGGGGGSAGFISLHAASQPVLGIAAFSPGISCDGNLCTSSASPPASQSR